MTRLPSPGRWPILMYHALSPGAAGAAPQSPETAADMGRGTAGLGKANLNPYTIPAATFARHLEALVHNRLKTPTSWHGLAASQTSGYVWITFDDGHASDVELALPELQRHGFCAMFFIATDWIGRKGFMSTEQLRQLAAAGMLIGSHGCSHSFFSRMDPLSLEHELRASKEKLESILGLEVPAVSLPGGRRHPQIERIAQKAGYRHIFTSVPHLAGGSDAPTNWPRIAVTGANADTIVANLLAGDTNELRWIARKAAMRQAIRRAIGDGLYHRLYLWLLRRRQVGST